MAGSASVHLWYGEDTFGLKTAEAELVSRLVDPAMAAFNLNVLDGASTALSAAIAAARTMPFGAGHRLVVVRDCPYFSAKLAEDELALIDDLLEQGLPEGCALLFVVPRGLDGRLKQTAKIKERGQLRQFALPDAKRNPDQLVDWLMERASAQGFRLDRSVASQLVFSLGSNRYRLENELAKLGTYAGAAPITGETVALLAAPGDADIFDVMKAIAHRRPADAIKRLHTLLVTEPAAKILATMATVARRWLHTKTLAEKGLPPEAIAERLKGSPYTIKRDLGELGRWNVHQLANALQCLLAADQAIKGGAAKVHERLQLERLVLELVSLR